MNRTPSLTDTHCHLMLSAFKKDRSQVIERAREAGVRRILLVGIDLNTSRRAVELAERFEELFAAVGVHPHNAKDWNQASSRHLQDLASSPKVVALGELGLDYYRNLSPKEDQRRAFQDQLALAAELGLPAVVHDREATAEVLDFILAWSGDLPDTMSHRAGVLHAYSGSLESATKAIEGGFYLGIAGPVTYRNAKMRQEISSRLPIERVLVETDAPYLTPHPYRGRRNEPAYVRYVAEKFSKLTDMGYPYVAETCYKNAALLFGWDDGIHQRTLL